MTVRAHFDALKSKHEELSQQVDYAYAHHFSDAKLTELKKKRLRLKQEMQAFEEHQRASAA